MNEMLQEALAKLINESINGVTKGVDAGIAFMGQQLPDVIEQLLMWHAIRGGIMFLLGLVFMSSIIFYIKKYNSLDFEGATSSSFWVDYKSCTHNSTLSGGGFALGLVCLTLNIVGFILLGNIMDTIQILVAPKIWLIEYSANLAGSVSNK